MKVTFILPAIGKKEGEKYIKTWRLMEPLTISTLKALTPPRVETEFFDDRIELIDFDSHTDLVAISIEMYTARRAYAIADRFRARGVKTICGGYHPTLMPDEAGRHFDSVIQGNADRQWPMILADAAKGCLKATYRCDNGFAEGVFPNRAIYGSKQYSMLGLVETGRGCVFDCEFCTITAGYEKKYYRRSIEDIVEDIKRSGKKYFFFVDDNIVADQGFAIELFKALTPLKIRWSGQGSLTMANNDELLHWMKKSGCMVILIGYESLDPKNLKQMNKAWTMAVGQRDVLTQKIHNHGIGIYATFLFGFDNDLPKVYEDSLAFAKKHHFFFVAFNHLLPFPGTRLHDRLHAENRLIEDEWWLKDGYRYGDIPYHPATMTPEELSGRCEDLRHRFFTMPSIVKRAIVALKRHRSLITFGIFLSQNLNLRHEVSKKMRLPIGDGLDGLPK